MNFEIENINGVLKVNPETLELNKVIGLVRITSPDKSTNCHVVLKHKGLEYDSNKILSAYGLPQYIVDFPIYNGRITTKDISEFQFMILPPNIKLKVELFEATPIKSRDLFNHIERQPIKYTVENKNGVHEYSDSFEINDRVKILRVIIMHPVGERNPITYIVKKISNKDKNLKFDDSSTASSGQCSTVNHFDIDEFISHTNDLKFELIENSKIQVHLLFKEREPIQYDYPTINLFE